MRIPRIYHPELLTSGTQISLCEDAANHIGRVLRMGPGQALQLSTAAIRYSMLKSLAPVRKALKCK